MIFDWHCKHKWYILPRGPLDYFAIEVYKRLFLGIYLYVGSISKEDAQGKSRQELAAFLDAKFK